MSIRTLREVCEVLHISRRTIQGYEELGLLIPSGKNDRGWLLYDESCQERIKLLKFYQSAGFKGKEIKVLLAVGEEERREMLQVSHCRKYILRIYGRFGYFNTTFWNNTTFLLAFCSGIC